MPRGKPSRPRKGTYCTLSLPDGDGGTIVPYAVYAYLGYHPLKDADGWYEAWMLRSQWPKKHEISFFSALPDRVQTWPTLPKARAWVEKWKVDEDKEGTV